MVKKLLLALAACAAFTSAQAANSPDDIFLEKIRALQYYASGQVDYRNGVQRLILSVNQSDGQLMGALGRAFMRVKDFNNALGVLISAVRVAPSNADAQADLAYVSAVVGPDCQTSRTAYDRAVSLNPALAKQWPMQQAQAMCNR